MLQLAHYQRMLEAVGFAAREGRHGGIVGVEEEVVWYDLDALVWLTPSSTGRQKRRSTMEVYDFEFDFRLDILAVALEHQADESVPLLVVPVRTSECETCPWWSWCGPALNDGDGDVSLLPGTGWRGFKVHRDHEPLRPAGEASLFGGFWEWLEDLRSVAAANGLTFRAYCYNDGAENTHLRRLAPMLGLQDHVEAFIASDEWVDLRRVFEAQLVTGGPVGLKKTAPLSGFAWEVDDPGGDVSMVYYETAVQATDATEEEGARTWLLTYNRNDVEATASLRYWLATSASSCPPIESLGS
jgi:predicted RecB family nuclease